MAEEDTSYLPTVNASPLIFLSRAGYLDLLHLLAGEVLVPDSVAHEIRRRGSADITVRGLEEREWIRVVPTPSIPVVIQAWDLGPGESAVLALAYERPGTEAIIDDLAGHCSYRRGSSPRLECQRAKISICSPRTR